MLRWPFIVDANAFVQLLNMNMQNNQFVPKSNKQRAAFAKNTVRMWKNQSWSSFQPSPNRSHCTNTLFQPQTSSQNPSILPYLGSPNVDLVLMLWTSSHRRFMVKEIRINGCREQVFWRGQEAFSLSNIPFNRHQEKKNIAKRSCLHIWKAYITHLRIQSPRLSWNCLSQILLSLGKEQTWIKLDSMYLTRVDRSQKIAMITYLSGVYQVSHTLQSVSYTNWRDHIPYAHHSCIWDGTKELCSSLALVIRGHPVLSFLQFQMVLFNFFGSLSVPVQFGIIKSLAVPMLFLMIVMSYTHPFICRILSLKLISLLFILVLSLLSRTTRCCPVLSSFYITVRESWSS